MRWLLMFAVVAVLAVLACGHRSIPERKPKYDALSRDDFNRFAVRANEPVFWIADKNHDRRIDPDEVAALLFYPTERSWVENGKFTRAFETAFNRIVAARSEVAKGAEIVPDPPTDPDGRERRKLVVHELDLAPAVLVQTDLRGEPFVPHIVAAATLVDQLYDVQAGATMLADRLPADLESRSLFRRDHGASCVSSKYRTEPMCSAVPGAPAQPVAVYPAVLQHSATFCDAFARRRVDRYSIEHGASDVPYSRAYASQARAIAGELIAAADALHGSPESALEDYLRAAAESFTSNDWTAADAAFTRITPETSKWYVRVGPDDVSWEPCKHKAGFHLTFARHDPTVYPWQPAILRTAPEVYELILAAGYARAPLGVPAVEHAAGKTVVFANLYDAPDSDAIERTPVEEVLDAATAKVYRSRRDVDVLLAQLRETAPQPTEAGLGSELATGFGELAAEATLFTRIEQLRASHAIADDLANQATLAATVAILARMDELFDPAGARLKAPHAVGIMTGMLVEQGALAWTATPSANGAPGSFSYHADRVSAAIAAIAATVTQIINRSDRAAATALAARYADEKFVPYGVIAYRFRIASRPSFVYSVTY